jgi:hypothetical protein
LNWSAVFHFTLVYIFALLLAGFQTTFWYQVFGTITPPLLWLVVFTYIVIYRAGISALFQLVFLAMMLAAFSGTNVKVFYAGLLLYFLFIYFVKSRIFWSGAGYFLLMCTVGAVAYHVIFFTLTAVIDRSRPEWLLIERATQILLTPSFAFPIFWVMQGVDAIFFRRELKAEVTGGTAYD